MENVLFFVVSGLLIFAAMYLNVQDAKKETSYDTISWEFIYKSRYWCYFNFQYLDNLYVFSKRFLS